ncbi:hypothetical protein SS50377_21369 [Spironucleus salmonicida]|uniref:Uncharacterized protein n=1 Tax=Spironucleus salmonicida TaxID=348837 RepID=V6LTW8_9EUKA|nr:hypothetical protein SS50377_21369 [Spironucleus salmonicida]|eukprot:EST44219.1 Hypothetical protein SS50377_15942 [Spironucleus salmonicida]
MNYAKNSQMYFYGNVQQRRIVQFLCKQYSLKCDLSPPRNPKPFLTDLDKQIYNMTQILQHLALKVEFKGEIDLEMIQKVDQISVKYCKDEDILADISSLQQYINFDKKVNVWELYLVCILTRYFEENYTKEKALTELPICVQLCDKVFTEMDQAQDCWGKILWKVERKKRVKA